METTSDPLALVRATDRRVVPTEVDGLPARVVTAGRTYAAECRRRLGRPDLGRAAAALVRTGQRRPRARRALPGRGQRRRRDPDLRAAATVRGDLGVHGCHQLAGGRADRGRRGHPARAAPHPAHRQRLLDPVRSRAPPVSAGIWDCSVSATTSPGRRTWIRRRPRPGRCRRRARRSPPGARTAGPRPTSTPVPTRRPLAPPGRPRVPSTAASRPAAGLRMHALDVLGEPVRRRILELIGRRRGLRRVGGGHPRRRAGSVPTGHARST